jgi:hypothetical protein
MTADKVTSIEQPEALASANHAEAAALVQGGAAALIASGQAMINGGQAMHGALLAFLQSRAKEGLAAGQRLAGCGSPQAALEIQLDFAREALQAYGDQFTRLNELAGEALDASLRPYHRRAAAPSDPAGELAA